MRMLKFASLPRAFSHLINALLSFIYPPICIHCESVLSQGYTLICQPCFLELEMLSHQERCRNCFNILDTRHAQCTTCKSALFTGISAVFDYTGAATTFYNKLKTMHGSYLCRSASSFMAMQYLQTNWPLPDIIVPLPQSWGEMFFNSHHHTGLIAQELALLFNRPYQTVFHYHFKKKRFSLANEGILKNKNVLLVGDLLTTQGKMHQYAEILAEGYPKNLYGITLCQVQ
ncbi:Uncharacterized protein PHSC3_000748 [Chlamydiales bacterium STE3]|nr:Uncharacterized protein PHSC3_000748 [Chlamydiales bacterium STE3]